MLKELKDWLNYHSAQLNEPVHDPAQAWNALTVGAHTELDLITDPSLTGFQCLAPRGGLSPFSSTSRIWEKKWPVKPEIVMEGGNLAHDGNGFWTECSDLAVLSTNWKPLDSHFERFNMTSAASAQAACFAAQIQSWYPDFWPETVRALMVHSAEWTDTLKNQFLEQESKTDYAELLRICGYGVPNLERALYSASNSLTLISEREIQPFGRKDLGSGFKTQEMHFYELPWQARFYWIFRTKCPSKCELRFPTLLNPDPEKSAGKTAIVTLPTNFVLIINGPGSQIRNS